MPFKVGAANLPKHVRDAPENEQKVWVDGWDEKYEEERKKGRNGPDAEAAAFEYANGLLKKVQGREGGPESKEAAKGKKVTVTRGMANAAKDVKMVCPKCGLKIPKYAGRYPRHCPKCDAVLKVEESARVEELVDVLIEESAERELTGEQKARVGVLVERSGEVEEKDVEELIEEIREAKLVQTRDGVGYGKECFAYVPDGEKPSTWKLLLKDRDGSWSMVNLAAAAAALGKGYRGKKVQLPQAERGKVKAKIRAGYRALGKKEEDMPRSIREAQSRAMVGEDGGVDIEEATSELLGKGLLPIRLLEPGWNDNKSRYYSEESVKEIAEKFRGVKMFVNHPTSTEKRERPEGDVWSWVANVESTRVAESGAAVGMARINDPQFKTKVQGLEEAGHLKDLGVSIRAVGRGARAVIEGVKTHLIEGIIKPRSCDFVTEPGAGGRCGLTESGHSGQEDGEEYDVDLIEVAQLRVQRPDLVKEIEDGVRENMRKELSGKMEAEERVKELEKENTELEEANKKLTVEKEAEEAAKRKVEAQGKIKELVEAEKELPEATRQRLVVRFAKAESVEGIAEAIAEEKKYLADLNEDGKVKDFGSRDAKTGDPVSVEESEKELQKEFGRLGLAEKVAETAAKI